MWILLRKKLIFSLLCFSFFGICLLMLWCSFVLMFGVFLISVFRKVLSWVNFGLMIVLMCSELLICVVRLCVVCLKFISEVKISFVLVVSSVLLWVSFSLCVVWWKSLMLVLVVRCFSCRLSVGCVRCSCLVVWVILFLCVIVIKVCNVFRLNFVILIIFIMLL